MKIEDLSKKILVNLFNCLKRCRISKKTVLIAICLSAAIYFSFGIYFGIQIYKYKSNSGAIKISAYLYPFPAAFVNGKLIFASSYYQQLDYIQQFSSKTQQKFADQADLRKKILDVLTENEIIQFQALKYNQRVSQKDFDVAYQHVVEQAGGETEMKKVLNDLYGMSEREFKNLVREKVLREQLKNNLMVQVQVAHIFVKDENRAKDIAEKAKKGDNFGDLAKQYSQDLNSRDKAGELGWLGKGQLMIENNPLPEFDAAVFSSQVGDIVGPIKTKSGFEIVKVEAKKGFIDESFDGWLANLAKQAKIIYFIK